MISEMRKLYLEGTVDICLLSDKSDADSTNSAKMYLESSRTSTTKHFC